jgi:hypothetical protein
MASRPGFGLAVVVVLLLLAACNAEPRPTTAPTAAPTNVPLTGRTPGPGEVAVPIERWEPVNGVPVACGGVGFVGEYRLHGAANDPRVVWMTQPDGTRAELAWPVGYSARFTPDLELLDDMGEVVGREGSLVTGGCRTPAGADVWWIELEPLSAGSGSGPS